MSKIEQKLLETFVVEAAQRLKGDWVFLGSSFLTLALQEDRPTVDIDVASLSTATNHDALILMEIADKLGLPPETVNQAAGYFLRKILGWEKELVSIHKGENCTLYRPSVSLFVSMKLQRLTESDLNDCLLTIKKFDRITEKIKFGFVFDNLNNKKNDCTPEQLVRIHIIEKALTELSKSLK